LQEQTTGNWYFYTDFLFCPGVAKNRQLCFDKTGRR